MLNPHEASSPRGRPARRGLKHLGAVLLISALSTTALMAADCGGGGGSCQACRDDCAKNGIPPSQCNCEGCTP